MRITVQEVIDHLTKSVGPIKDTIDSLKSGSPDQEVTGIAVSFMPTYEAINEAIERHANLLVTHEGVFFSHWDDNELGENKVYDKKLHLIRESGLAIYRNHDSIHRYQPDGITEGLVDILEWVSHVQEHQPAATILTIPEMTLGEVADYVKAKLNIDFVRCVGDLSTPVSRIGILVGYRGGGSTCIPLFEEHQLDLILYGEGPEWETPEYVRDAISQGEKKALMILGHAESEEPGMAHLAQQLEESFTEVPVHFISTKLGFKVI